MPERVGVFSVPDARRIAEATRITLGGPRNVLGAPHRPSRAHAPLPLNGGDLPPGVHECSATNCAEGADVGSAICCKTHKYWTATIPPFGQVTFTYVSGEIWESATIPRICAGADGTYKFRRTLSGSGGSIVSTIELVTVSAGDCSPAWCLVYKTCCKITCACSQRHTLVSFGGFSSETVSGEICLIPGGSPTDVSCSPCITNNWRDDTGAAWQVVLTGFTSCTTGALTCNMTPVNGTHVLSRYSACGFRKYVTLAGYCCDSVAFPQSNKALIEFSESSGQLGVSMVDCPGCGTACHVFEIALWGGQVKCQSTEALTAPYSATCDTTPNPDICGCVSSPTCTIQRLTELPAATEDGACDSPCVGYGGGGSTCAGSKTYTAIDSGIGIEWGPSTGSCTGTCTSGTCAANPPSTPPTYVGQEATVPCSCT